MRLNDFESTFYNEICKRLQYLPLLKLSKEQSMLDDL